MPSYDVVGGQLHGAPPGYQERFEAMKNVDEAGGQQLEQGLRERAARGEVVNPYGPNGTDQGFPGAGRGARLGEDDEVPDPEAKAERDSYSGWFDRG